MNDQLLHRYKHTDYHVNFTSMLQCATSELFSSKEMCGLCLCVMIFLYCFYVLCQRDVIFILRRLLNCCLLISLSDMLKFPNYVFHTLKSSFKSFPANLSGPQNWLWCLWTHSPKGHEFKSQVGEGGCHGSLIFSSRPFPLSFPHLTQPSFQRLDKYEHQACYFCLLI